MPRELRPEQPIPPQAGAGSRHREVLFPKEDVFPSLRGRFQSLPLWSDQSIFLVDDAWRTLSFRSRIEVCEIFPPPFFPPSLLFPVIVCERFFLFDRAKSPRCDNRIFPGGYSRGGKPPPLLPPPSLISGRQRPLLSRGRSTERRQGGGIQPAFLL